MECPKCKQLLELASLHCPGCGMAIAHHHCEEAADDAPPTAEPLFPKPRAKWRLPLQFALVLLLLYAGALLLLSAINRAVERQLQAGSWTPVTATLSGRGNDTLPPFTISGARWRIKAKAVSSEHDAGGVLVCTLDAEPPQQALRVRADNTDVEWYLPARAYRANHTVRFPERVYPWQAYQRAALRLPAPVVPVTHTLTLAAPADMRWEVRVEEVR